MSLPAPVYQDEAVTLYQADALRILDALPPGSVDALVTDPPYSSGGAMRSDRNQRPSEKYVMTGTFVQRPDFSGDNRDQRSFFAWCTLWLTAGLWAAVPGGVALVFTDWRQLPILTDALQAAGWVWRGVNVWDKTEGVRPTKGWYRAQGEYIVAGTRGPRDRWEAGPAVAGLFRHSSGEKLHITGKPLPLMVELLSIFRPGSVVCDPFAGGGTTLVAAKALGLQAIGVESEAVYCTMTAERCAQQVLGELAPRPAPPDETLDLLAGLQAAEPASEALGA